MDLWCHSLSSGHGEVTLAVGAADWWELLSMTWQHSFKRYTDENVTIRLFRHCRIKERLAGKLEVLSFGGRHCSEGSK